MKVRLMNKISQEGLKRLPADRYEVGEDLDHADAIMVRSASLHDAEFEPELKCIARAGAGVNNIPLDRCSEQGIVVFNTPGGNSNAVKELTIAGLLLASRKIVKGIEWVKTLDPEGIAKAVEKGKSQFAGPEIAGKKLGVIGLGAIGVQVANAAAALGMDVYGYDPYISVRAAWTLKARIHHISELKAIFEECDYITLHLPLMDGRICDGFCQPEADRAGSGDHHTASGRVHAGERGQLRTHGGQRDPGLSGMGKYPQFGQHARAGAESQRAQPHLHHQPQCA